MSMHKAFIVFAFIVSFVSLSLFAKNQEVVMGINVNQGKDTVVDYISGKVVPATPEEIEATQPFSRRLVEDYGYPKSMIVTRPQYRVKASPSDKKGYPIDIAVFEKSSAGVTNLKIVVENKKKTRKDGRGQLEDYLKFSEAEVGVWYNGTEMLCIRKIEKSGHISFEEIGDFPKYGQKISEIGKYLRKDLVKTHNLKSVFDELRGWIAGNSVGVNRDEVIAKEMIHLILCKIFDEKFTAPDDMVEFRAATEDSIEDVQKRILQLFKKVKGKYNDVLADEDTISFDAATLKYIVEKIQGYCISETDRDIVADAFEVFIGQSLKGEQGQFFTPKNVVRMLVNAIDPNINDMIIDPSCGSGGFLVESLKYLWNKVGILGKKLKWNESALIEEKKAIGIKKIRGIEKDSFLAKVAKSYMAILGDGKGGIFCEDSLELTNNWSQITQQHIHLNSFNVSFSNPPFGKEIKVIGKDKLAQYDLAFKINSKGKKTLVTEGNISTLFLERNVQLLQDGGRLAIILPETYFHAPKQRAAREFMYRHNIQWIIDLPHDTFRPHNNAKCIAIVLQKNTPQQKNINMAVAEYIGHDHNGNPIYKKDENGSSTSEVYDDANDIIEEIRHFNRGENFERNFTFQVDAEKVIDNDILVPRYYWGKKIADIKTEAKINGYKLVSLRELIDEGIISYFDGNGSPKAEFKGIGEYPYIRVKDIVNWQIYRDPTALLPKSEFDKLYSEKKRLHPKDILYVRRGSYRIGSVAMASPYDKEIVLTREILVLRVMKADNKYGITPEYLLYALSHNLTALQAKNKVFLDTTLPNIASRWQELEIPVIEDKEKYSEMKLKMERVVKHHWEALKEMDELWNSGDIYNM